MCIRDPHTTQRIVCLFHIPDLFTRSVPAQVWKPFLNLWDLKLVNVDHVVIYVISLAKILYLGVLMRTMSTWRRQHRDEHQLTPTKTPSTSAQRTLSPFRRHHSSQ